MSKMRTGQPRIRGRAGRRRWVLSALLIVVAAVVGGCLARSRQAAPAHPESGGTAPPVWPPPPSQPRIRYEATLAMPADFNVRVSWWRSAMGVVTGTRRDREPFVRPYGIATDEEGNVCLTDMGSGTVYLFEKDARRFKRWQKIGKTRFETPVAIVKAEGLMYVADSSLGRIIVFDEKGRLRYEIAEELVRPTGLALFDDRLLVTDAKAHRVAIFSTDGTFIRSFGQRGTAPGDFNFPTHIAVDKDGLVYVTDALNFRIQVFDMAGHLKGGFGHLGDGSGQFSRPKGVALDAANHVYVVDALFDNVQVFNPAGEFLMHWGSAGSGLDEFWLPTGIAVHDEQILVADSFNRRVQVFRYVGLE